MKQAAFYILILCSGLFYSSRSIAQPGWQWGSGGINCPGDAFNMTTDRAGNVFTGGLNLSYLAGYGPDTLHRGYEYFVAKANGSGSFLWAKETDSPSLGSGTTMAIPGMVTDASGNLYELLLTDGVFAMGTFSYSTPSHSFCYILIKFSPTGVVRWAKFVANTGAYTSYGGVGTDGAGNVYATGVYSQIKDTIGTFILNNSAPGTGTNDIFLAKFDTSGNVIWAENIGGRNEDDVSALTTSNNGDIYITGAYVSDTMSAGSTRLVNPALPLSSEAYILAFDSSGNPRWGKNISSRAFITSMKTDQFENSYLLGLLYGSTSIGPDTFTVTGRPLLLAKYDSSGSVVWATDCPADHGPYPYNLDIDSCGIIWFCGSMGDSIVFPGHTLRQPIPTVSFPTFMAEYNSSGMYLSSMAIPIESDDWTGVAVDNKGSVYLAGDYYTTTIFGHDTLGSDPAYPSAEYIYVGKFTYSRDTSNIIDTSLCSGSIASGVNLSGPAGYTSYLWNTGSSTGFTSIDTPGTYWVSATGTCTKITDSFIVSVMPADTAYHVSDTSICHTSDTYISITLTAPTGSNYTWFDGASGPIDSVHSQGSYWVQYTLGCNYYVDTFKVTITTSSPPCYTATNNIIPKNEMQIFPNPATEELTIITDNNSYSSLIITNSIGQKLIEEKLNFTQTSVDIKSLPQGLYYVILKGENGNQVRKFLKE